MDAIAIRLIYFDMYAIIVLPYFRKRRDYMYPGEAMGAFDPKRVLTLQSALGEAYDAARRANRETFSMVEEWMARCVAVTKRTDQSGFDKRMLDPKRGYIITLDQALLLMRGLNHDVNCDENAHLFHEWLEVRLEILEAERPNLFAFPVRVAYLDPTHGYADTPVFAIVSKSAQ